MGEESAVSLSSFKVASRESLANVMSAAHCAGFTAGRGDRNFGIGGSERRRNALAFACPIAHAPSVSQPNAQPARKIPIVSIYSQPFSRATTQPTTIPRITPTTTAVIRTTFPKC